MREKEQSRLKRGNTEKEREITEKKDLYNKC